MVSTDGAFRGVIRTRNVLVENVIFFDGVIENLFSRLVYNQDLPLRVRRDVSKTYPGALFQGDNITG